MRISFKLLAAGSAALALLVACGGGGSLNGDTQIRLVNATSEFASLDLYEGTNSLSSGTPSYGAGGYAGVDDGNVTLNVKSGGSSATAATLTTTIGKDDRFTLVAYTSAGTLATTLLSDEESEPGAGTAKLRFFHTASADAGNVDAYLLSTPCSGIASAPAAPTATGVSGLQDSYSQVSAASGGTVYHLCITAAGDKADLRLDVPALTLSEKQVVTVILTRSAGGVLLNGLVLVQQGGLTPALNTSARMRLAVGAAGGATVTASVAGVALGTGLSAPGVGSYKLVPAGAVTADLVVGGVAAAPASLTAPAGADLTLLATGTAATAPVLIADDNTVSTSTTRPVKLRLVNGMNGAGNVVLTDDFDNIGEAAAFGASSGYAQVESSAALARLEATDGVKQLCLSTTVTLQSGKVYTVFLLGDVPAVAGPCTVRVDR